jgi:hypothetical protein
MLERRALFTRAGKSVSEVSRTERTTLEAFETDKISELFDFSENAIDTVTKRGTIFLAANIIEPQWFPDPAVISASVILFLLQGIGAL